MAIHHDLLAFGRVFAVAFAVGLDVFAISLAVGTAQLNRNASVHVGMAFASAEIVMQVIGYGLGTGANHIFGEVAVYVGFALLATPNISVRARRLMRLDLNETYRVEVVRGRRARREIG